MKNHIKIETPHGIISTKINKNGKTITTLTWNSGFGAECTKALQTAQDYVDSEVLRLNAAYVPIVTGMLRDSGTLGTDIGSGEVQYIAPYAVPQYYSKESRIYDPKRGGQWFERMKIDHKDEIFRGVATLVKEKSK